MTMNYTVQATSVLLSPSYTPVQQLYVRCGPSASPIPDPQIIVKLPS